MNDRVADESTNRKTRDRAGVLLVVAVILVMPPAAGIFELKASIGGLPVTLVYLFTVWAGLIGATFWISRGLARQQHPDPERAGDDPPRGPG